MFMIGFVNIWDGPFDYIILGKAFLFLRKLFISSLRADANGYRAWVFVFGSLMIFLFITPSLLFPKSRLLIRFIFAYDQNIFFSHSAFRSVSL
jgi:hypothetical protein